MNKRKCHHLKSNIQLKNTMKLFLTKCAHLMGGGLPKDSVPIVFEILTWSYIVYYLIKDIISKLSNIDVSIIYPLKKIEVNCIV